MSSKKISFMRSLCMGVIEQDVIMPFPKIGSAESETLQGVLETLNAWLKSQENHFREWDKEGVLPKEIIEEMKKIGLFSLIIPEKYNGLGLSSSGYSRVIQEISKYDGSIAITTGAHSSIGMRGLVLFGTPEQKEKFLPKLATGELIAAFCLTEPGSGSDAASIQTKATLNPDGTWTLNGQKLWITNGGMAGFLTVFAKTESKEGQISAFIVTGDLPGVSFGPHEDKMGLRASATTAVHFENVIVPKENLLGELGKGFKIAMTILNNGRSGLGGGCIGTMKHLIELSSKQAKTRVQFGRPIAEFGLIKQKIGHMVVDCYASESVVSMVASLSDQGYEDFAVEAAISKVFSTECLWRTADEALQIAGGNGFMREFPYERILRDARINRIFEGTNEILRLFISLTGMKDVGQTLHDLSSSLEGIFNDPIKGFGVLSDYGLRRFAQVTGVGRGEKSVFSRLHPRIRNYGIVFEGGVRHLALAADRILRKHGKNIVDKQFAIKRLSDIMIDLFVLACVLSRVSSQIDEQGEQKCAKEIEILTILTGQIKRRVKSHLSKIDQNDDELIKSLAHLALERESYIWDTLS